jgi:acyl-CoA reductase-like NAD-dependent aldehyde dehydrogenase
MTSDIVKHTQIFINNQFVNSVSGKTFPIYNPATEEVIANVQEADAADVDFIETLILKY